MKRAIATATRVAKNNEGNDDSNKGGGQATAITTLVGEDEGSSNGNEDER
jgi:hypothetical protein